MQITLSAVTHPGHERTNNEDAFAFCPDITHSIWKHETCNVTQTLSPLGSLLLVADGIGGFNAGEVASEIAVRAIAETFTPEAATKSVVQNCYVVPLLMLTSKSTNTSFLIFTLWVWEPRLSWHGYCPK